MKEVCSLDSDSLLQVPLLLSIGEEDTALMKAIESGDTDLVYLVLFHIWQKVICLETQHVLRFFCYKFPCIGLRILFGELTNCFIMQREPLAFFKMIHPKPLARDLFVIYAR